MQTTSLPHSISDCTGANIMMDGRPILPDGWHFVRDSFTSDGLDIISPLARIDYPVRYFFVDFGMSIRFQPESSPLITGCGGRDKDVPELSDINPYDAFKVDIFTVGNVLLKDFYQVYTV